MVRPTVVALFLVGVLGCVLAACYDAPKPVCGFYCGADFSCPDEYSCQRGRCILNSALATIDPEDIGKSCELVDAGGPPPPDVGPFDVPIGPMVVARMPDNLADDVSAGTTIMATFSEPVTMVSTSTFSVFEQLPQGGSEAVLGTVTQPTPTTAVFTPAAPLTTGAAHQVFLSSPIADLDGNQLPFTQWSFTTEPDTVAPTIVARTPAPGATDVPVDAAVTVQFSERVLNVDFTTFVLRAGGVQIGGNVTYDDAARTATFTLFGHLEPNTTYEAAVSGAIIDRGNNPLAGAPITWSFTTGPDTIPPRVISHGPNGPGVSPTDTVFVQFDEEVMNVTSATFTLRAGATVIPSTVTYFAGVAQAQLVPNAQLGSNVTYTVTLDAAITDASGNALADAPVTWTFTTIADTTPPMVSGRSPLPGTSSAGPDTLVSVTFSEPVFGVSNTTLTIMPGGGAVAYDASSHAATLFPTPALAAGTTYTVTIAAGITDNAGNPLPPQQWSFTTKADVTPPTAMLGTPTNGATGVATTTPIVVVFDEPVPNVSLTTLRVYAPSPAPVAGTLASLDDQTWTFTPSMPLPTSTTVTVSLSSAIRDNANNQLLPVSYSFTTAP